MSVTYDDLAVSYDDPLVPYDGGMVPPPTPPPAVTVKPGMVESEGARGGYATPPQWADHAVLYPPGSGSLPTGTTAHEDKVARRRKAALAVAVALYLSDEGSLL